MTIRLKVGYKGGAGSGNWGHASRPGHEGGSLPKGQSAGGGGGITQQKPGTNGPRGNTTDAGAKPGLTPPTLSIPSGQLPEHTKGDTDGKQAYQDWYGSLDQKPNLADALAMRKFFAERALEAEGELSVLAAQQREENRKKAAEEKKNAPKVLTPAEKKKQEAAKKKAASDAAKAKKKAESEATKKKKAEESAAKKAKTAADSAAKKAAAEAKKAEAAQAKQDAATKKIADAQAKADAKLQGQLKVAEAVGLSETAFNNFQDAIQTLKAGGNIAAGVGETLVEAGLLKKMGDTFTAPPAAMSLLSAILSADAIKARTALEKLGSETPTATTKEIGKVKVVKRTITRYKLG